MSSCTNRIGAFNNLFALMCSQARDKQNLVHDILLLKYLFNNLLLNVSMQNTFSKFVELLLENLITKFLNAKAMNEPLLEKTWKYFGLASC